MEFTPNPSSLFKNEKITSGTNPKADIYHIVTSAHYKIIQTQYHGAMP